MSDPPSRTSLRTRRIPSRPDEVVSLAPRARATVTPEGSAPPEAAAPIQALLSDHSGEEMELDPGPPSIGLPLSREPDTSPGHIDSDDDMPALDSHEESSEDEAFAAPYRAGLRPTPVPPVHGPQEGMFLLLHNRIIISLLPPSVSHRRAHSRHHQPLASDSGQASNSG